MRLSRQKKSAEEIIQDLNYLGLDARFDLIKGRDIHGRCIISRITFKSKEDLNLYKITNYPNIADSLKVELKWTQENT